jgi:threonine dehydrogenase-like Zn-dependent dehydrogenase
MKAAVITAEWAPKPDYPLSEEERRTRVARIGSSVWKHPSVTVNEVERPACGPEDVLVRVAAAGLCGSDLHFFETDAEGYMKYPGTARFPSVPGHEVAGKIVAVGSRVRYLKVGDLVCLDDMVVCGSCGACRRGFPNQCENLDDVGFTMDGGFAEFVRVPERNCWNINALLPRFGHDEQRVLEAGAVIEPFTVAYNALFECAGRIKPGAYTAVFGAGPIGLATIQLLHATGAALIIAFEHHPGRRELARRFGAHQVYSANGDKNGTEAHQIVLRETAGSGADVQVEAAGAFNQTVTQMELCAANGSQVIIIGRDRLRVPLFLENFQCKKANVIGAMGNTGYATYPNVIRMMAAGLIDPTPMITDRFHLEHFGDALATARRRQGGKVLIHMNGKG